MEVEFERAREREDEVGFDRLSLRDQVLITVWNLEAEVNNGGFDQYYFNSSGDQASLAPTMFRAIGAHRMASLVELANAVFGADGPPSDRDERQSVMENLSAKEPWEKLDQEFCAYPDDVSALLAKFLDGPFDT